MSSHILTSFFLFFTLNFHFHIRDALIALCSFIFLISISHPLIASPSSSLVGFCHSITSESCYFLLSHHLPLPISIFHNIILSSPIFSVNQVVSCRCSLSSFSVFHLPFLLCNTSLYSSKTKAKKCLRASLSVSIILLFL